MNRTVRFGLLCGVVAALLPCQIAALAQDAGQGQGGRGQARFARTVTAASAPVSALDWGLSLNAEQKRKITAIHDKFVADTKDLLPQRGTRPDPNTTRENLAKWRDLSGKADKEV